MRKYVRNRISGGYPEEGVRRVCVLTSSARANISRAASVRRSTSEIVNLGEMAANGSCHPLLLCSPPQTLTSSTKYWSTSYCCGPAIQEVGPVATSTAVENVCLGSSFAVLRSCDLLLSL